MIEKIQALADPGLITHLDLADYWGRSGKKSPSPPAAGTSISRSESRSKISWAVSSRRCRKLERTERQMVHHTTADVPPGEIWILTATAANLQEQTRREAVCVPPALRWPTEFKT